MIVAGMITHTSVTDFLQLTVRQFYEILLAAVRVAEKRKS